jgi:hypothetical protein
MSAWLHVPFSESRIVPFSHPALRPHALVAAYLTRRVLRSPQSTRGAVSSKLRLAPNITLPGVPELPIPESLVIDCFEQDCHLAIAALEVPRAFHGSFSAAVISVRVLGR